MSRQCVSKLARLAVLAVSFGFLTEAATGQLANAGRSSPASVARALSKLEADFGGLDAVRVSPLTGGELIMRLRDGAALSGEQQGNDGDGFTLGACENVRFGAVGSIRLGPGVTVRGGTFSTAISDTCACTTRQEIRSGLPPTKYYRSKQNAGSGSRRSGGSHGSRRLG